jgi:hypothetical protein
MSGHRAGPGRHAKYLRLIHRSVPIFLLRASSLFLFILFLFFPPVRPPAINKFSKNFILWVFSSSSSSIMIASRVIFHFVSFFCAPKKKSTN